MIKRCLIVDTETNGLNPETDKIIEVAAILYSVEHRTILQQFSSILTMDEPSNACVEINRIPVAAIEDVKKLSDGHVNELTCGHLRWMYEASDIIAAHNAEFDKSFLRQIGWAEFDNWVDTASDFTWPKCSDKRLTQIAIAYDVPVISSHRALDDCRLIASLFDRRDDLQAAFELAMRPCELYVATISYEDRQRAKDAGFNWNEPVPRRWSRRLTAEEAAEMKFPIAKVVMV